MVKIILSLFLSTLSAQAHSQIDQRLGAPITQEVKEALAKRYTLVDTMTSPIGYFEIIVHSGYESEINGEFTFEIGYHINDEDGSELTSIGMQNFTWGYNDDPALYTLKSIDKFSEDLLLDSTPDAKLVCISSISTSDEDIYEFIISYK
ncbi:MAG: hypothetical protein WA958_07660 [Tunicatimonas sp.]